MSRYPTYSIIHKTTNGYQTTDTDDDDALEALRTAALKTLHSNKRKNIYDRSPVRQRSRSSSKSYSSSSRSSRSRSPISRSYSSLSLSSISSNSLDRHDKDYRFETKQQSSIGDIDERFPEDIPNTNNDVDALIVHCPMPDDDELFTQQQTITKHTNEQSRKHILDRDEREHHKLPSKDIKHQRNKREKSPVTERPVSITVKLNSDNFDLRQLIEKRRANDASQSNQRIVEILPKDDLTDMNRMDHNQTSRKYHRH